MFTKETANKKTSATVENSMDVIYLPSSEQSSESQENVSSESIRLLNPKLWNRIK